MAKSLVIGNWKMYGSLAFNQNLIEELAETMPALDNVTVAVCPPSTYLFQVFVELDANELDITLGAQNVCAQAKTEGAYTGEVSATMLADLEVKLGLVGHSERRGYYHEIDEIVLAKFKKLQAVGITPIVCVGESLEVREAGKALKFIRAQVASIIKSVGVEAFANNKAILAYEPIWAIGTGKTASPEQAQEVHAAMRSYLAEQDEAIAADVSILYGGSVKPDNAESLFSMKDIDGALVGGASLEAKSFVAICQAAEQAQLAK